MLIHWRPSAARGNSGRPTLECSRVGGCGGKVSGYTEDGGRGRSQTSTLLAGDRRGGGMTGESWRLRRRYEDEMQHCFNLANRCQMSQWFRPLWQSLPVKHDTFVVVRPIFFSSFFFKTWGRWLSITQRPPMNQQTFENRIQRATQSSDKTTSYTTTSSTRLMSLLTLLSHVTAIHWGTTAIGCNCAWAFWCVFSRCYTAN